MVFAKGKDGHYRYMKKSEVTKRHFFLKFLTFVFYVFIFAVFIFLVYYLYNEVFLPYMANR